MKKLLLLIASCAIGLSLLSCGESTRTTITPYSDVENAVAKFNDEIGKAHPELSQDDRKLLSQYVLSHIIRGEKLPDDLVIADAIKAQKSVNKTVSQIQ